LWALINMIWGLIGKATRFNAWDAGRPLLSSPTVTQLLIVGAVLLIALWASTSSIYLQLAGGKGGEYEVEVLRKSDRSPLVGRATLNAGHSVLGMPRFLQVNDTELECRIVRPVEYEPLDCGLTKGKSTRIAVPGSFKSKEYHLLRIVPDGPLYSKLPKEGDQGLQRFDLRIERNGETMLLRDLRRETVFLGASQNELPLVLRLHENDRYERYLDTRLRVAGYDAENASLTAAILSMSTRTLPGLYVKAGDTLNIEVTVKRLEESEESGKTLNGFPFTYRVTADPVQTLWLTTT
jgi:hypothetical protein